MKVDYLVYDRQYQEIRAKGWNGWGGNQRMARESIWIERLFSYPQLPTAGEALELGCGEGHYARLLAERGYTVTGVDVSPTAIQWAQEKSRDAGRQVRYLAADLTWPDLLPGETFDLVADGNCLHCILGADRKIFLANVYRWLKPGGLFFISSLCTDSALDEVSNFAGKPYRYIRSKTNLYKEVEAAGFDIKQANFYRKEIAEYSHGHCTLHLTKR